MLINHIQSFFSINNFYQSSLFLISYKLTISQYVHKMMIVNI